jgi:hypothetical protein
MRAKAEAALLPCKIDAGNLFAGNDGLFLGGDGQFLFAVKTDRPPAFLNTEPGRLKVATIRTLSVLSLCQPVA